MTRTKTEIKKTFKKLISTTNSKIKRIQNINKYYKTVLVIIKQHWVELKWTEMSNQVINLENQLKNWISQSNHSPTHEDSVILQ